MLQTQKITILIIAFLILGCSDKKATKEKNNSALTPISADSLVQEYFLENEKIFLLSYIKNIPEDTIKVILTEYLSKSSFNYFYDDKSEPIMDDVITSISQKRKISKSKIASIIFSYKYEMLTKEDLEMEAIENYNLEKEDYEAQKTKN